MSAARMGKKLSPETRARMSAAKKGKPGRKLSDYEKVLISLRKTACVVSEETKAKQRAAKLANPTRYWLGKKRGPSSLTQRAAVSVANRGKSHREDQCRFLYNGTWFRSTWEVRAVKAFDKLGIRWEYEPHRIDLGTETYLPDFYLPDDGAYWEVKGFYGDKSRHTVQLFRQLRAEPLVLATHAVLKQLEQAAASAA